MLFEVVGVIDNYYRPGDIHCTLQAPTLGHSVSSSAWVRVEASRPTMVPGPLLLCPRVSSSRSCQAPAPAAPLATTNEVKIPALGTLLCCRCGWRPPRADHGWSLLLGGLLGHSALARVKGDLTAHPWSLVVATIACRASARCLAHVTLCTQVPAPAGLRPD